MHTLLVRGLTAAGIAALVIAPSGAASAHAPGDLARVSLANDGSQHTLGSFTPAVSADGRFVAYALAEFDPRRGDGGTSDIMLRDTVAGTTTALSGASAGHAASLSLSPAVSDDGRFVAYESWADDLVPGDTNGQPDVFVHDASTGTTVRASSGPGGGDAHGFSWHAALSGDGHYLAFASDAPDIASGDTNGAFDVFVRDLRTGTTRRITNAPDGSAANGGSSSPSISADGRFVAFGSSATNLVPGATDPDLYLYDTRAGAISAITLRHGPREADHYIDGIKLSANGRFIVFSSDATNIVAHDTNDAADVFVHDRFTGITARAALSRRGGQPDGWSSDASISADGRYILYNSVASNIVDGDTRDTVDLFQFDRKARTTQRVDAHGSFPALSADAGSIVFATEDPLAPDDTNNSSDVYLRRR